MKARLPKGMGGGGPQNMNAMIKQAQKIQEDMKARQSEIEDMEFQTTAGGGMVEVVMTGKKEIKTLTIKPEIVSADDIEMLQDLIIAAANEAIRKVEEFTNAEMDQITGALNIPGVE